MKIVDLFDDIALVQMPAAEKTVRDAAVDISDELIERLESAKKLNEEDKATILKLAQQALTEFLAGAEGENSDLENNSLEKKNPGNFS